MIPERCQPEDQRENQRRIRAKWVHRLSTGDGVSPGWAGVMSIVNGLAAAGEPDTSIRQMLSDEGHAGVRYLHFDSKGFPRPQATRERFVRSAIQKVRARHAGSQPDRNRADVIADLARVREAVDSDPTCWKGRGGATSRSVFLACIAIAEAAGRREFGASARQIADHANVGVHAAHSATQRLIGLGRLRLVEKGSGTLASVWRLQVGRLGNLLSVPLETELEGSADFLNHDVFRWGALGKSKARVYGFLGQAPASVADLGVALGVVPRTVRYHLADLERYGLAARSPEGWIAGDADPASVARILEVDGRGERQRIEHKQRAQSRRERKPWERKEARSGEVFVEGVEAMVVGRGQSPTPRPDEMASPMEGVRS